VLRSTFLHIPGIGPKTERRIWDLGITRWDDFLESGISVNSTSARQRICEYVMLSKEALQRRDAEFFTRTLPKAEWWRLYDEFKEDTVFLDIETTGLSFYYNEITLVGLTNGKGPRLYVRGQNLSGFVEEIQKYSVMVTFNGTLFDLPFLRQKFGQLVLPPVHIDLRFLLKRLGYAGGLKSIESRFGIERDDEIKDIDGFGATALWNRYTCGDHHALELLVKYNMADVENLETLMARGYQMMRELTLGDLDSSLLRRGLPEDAGCHDFDILQTPLPFDCQSLLSHLVPISSDTCANSENMDTLTAAASQSGKPPRVLGIDLRASELRSTGWAIVEGAAVETGLLRTDAELIQLAMDLRPDLISIDSPLSLPKGRDCTSDACECRRLGITRECERTLRHRGINVFPCLLPSMQGLTRRGMSLTAQLRELGFDVIESYPGAAQDILGILRKKVSVDELKQGLIGFGLSGEFALSRVTHDELDAITSALVGYFYLSGRYEALGNPDEDYLILPAVNGHKSSPVLDRGALCRSLS